MEQPINTLASLEQLYALIFFEISEADEEVFEYAKENGLAVQEHNDFLC